MTQCKLCTRAAAPAVAVNKEVADGADGADVVFTDIGYIRASNWLSLLYNLQD